MTHRWRAVALLLVAVGSIACGKKGNPLPPLRPVPARIADASALRSDQTVTITFTVPATNLDGSTPPSISRVDLFVWQGAPGAVPPAASVIAGERRNFRSSIPVVPPADGQASPAAGPTAAAGGAATFSDSIANIDATTIPNVAYVLVPMSASGGRAGPPSPPLVVPVGAPPEPPSALALAHTEAELQVSWEAPITQAGRSFQVVRTTPAGEPVDPAAAPTVVSASPASVPVAFGREVCLAVRPVVVAGRVTVAGALSRPACLTPVDTFPPAAPAGLLAVQEGASVVLSWSAVTAADLAGYIVLRGVDDNLQPLTKTPLKETTFRDSSVKAGVTYIYAVYAVDTAAPANVSQLSNRQSVTVR